MEFLRDWLNGQRQTGNYRQLPEFTRLPGGLLRLAGQADDQPPLVDFSSNDYLGLSEHPDIIAASQKALARYGAGSGAARLMSGNHPLHRQLEAATASLKNKEAALVFGSGFMANVGVIPALAERGDTIFADRLCHASIIDGCRLAGARLIRFRHNDIHHLEDLLKKHHDGRALVIVESVYSMDGDFCPLTELAELKSRHDFLLMVDEAHATGVYGPNGDGLAAETGTSDSVDIAMGTYSKALGSYGAFIAGDRLLIDYLINRARSFIFSTALPPAVVAASLAAITLVRENAAMRRQLLDKTALFRTLLTEGGLQITSPSQIIPILIGDSDRALELVAELRDAGIFATAVRPPTVPINTARLRLSVTTHHTPDCLRRTAAILLQKVVRHE